MEEGEEDLEWIINATIDKSAPPDKQAEQVMAIFPVVDGQKPSPQNAIPAHKTEPPASQEPPKDAAPKEQPQDDLIDFGQNDEAAETKPAPAKTPGEIEQLLSSTGKPAGGPLLDFTQDVKKSLPPGTS